MNDPIITNGLRFVILVLLQVLIFNHSAFALMGIPVGLIFVYPLFIIYLPLSMQRVWVVILSFLIGMTVDIFSDTLGIHAAASVLTGFLRRNILDVLQPRGGYKKTQIPSIYHFGLPWFARLVLFTLAIHIVCFYLVLVFDLSHAGLILFKSIVSFLLSYGVLSLISIIHNPKV